MMLACAGALPKTTRGSVGRIFQTKPMKVSTVLSTIAAAVVSRYPLELK
jgi:hypothetical protein